MLRRAGTCLLMLSLVLTTGGHWAVLQAAAWTGMLVRFSRDGSLSEAVSKTFDGQHACRWCKFVRRGQAEQQQREQEAPGASTPTSDLLPSEASATTPPPQRTGSTARFGEPAEPGGRGDAPPVPPPRAA